MLTILYQCRSFLETNGWCLSPIFSHGIAADKVWKVYLREVFVDRTMRCRCCFCCWWQIHMPCMIITLLITAAAFIIIFVAVEGYSQVSKSLQMTVIHCVSKKRHPFYFCKNLAKYYTISIIFGSSIPEEICNKVCMFTHHTCLLCRYHTL